MRTLSMDGGISACTYVRLLRRLEELRPGFLRRTEMIVGSSAGSCTGVYLAYLLDQDELSGMEIADKLVDYVDRLLERMKMDGMKSYKKLIEGKEAMLSNMEFAPFIAEMTNFTHDTKLSTKLCLLSTLMGPPYTPQVHTNWGKDAMADFPLVEGALRSAAMSLFFPGRAGHLDGVFFVNNPAMSGLAKIIGEMGLESVDDLVMLSLGGDDGSSTLSNKYIPGDPMVDLPKPKPLPPGIGKLIPDMPVEMAEDVMNQARANLIQIVSKVFRIDFDDVMNQASANLIQMVNKVFRVDFDDANVLETECLPGDNQNWGWRQWLLYPANIGYLVQVLMNSHGRGSAWQCEQILGERLLRLAPVALMSMNEGSIMNTLGMTQEVIAYSEFAARAWGDKDTSVKYEFSPDLPLTLSWIDYHWMS